MAKVIITIEDVESPEKDAPAEIRISVGTEPAPEVLEQAGHTPASYLATQMLDHAKRILDDHAKQPEEAADANNG